MYSGKGLTLAAARLSALGEACERYAGACIDLERIVRASRAELDDPSIDPVDLVLFAPHQYDELPYSRWDPATALDWVHGVRLHDGARVAVPALATFMHYHVRRPQEYLFPITSNGLAAGPSFREAALAALLEVIERDAFIIGWLQRLPGRRIDPGAVSDDVRRIAAGYARRGVSLELVALPTDAPATVVVALGIQEEGDGPAAAVGLGCDVDPVAACFKASLEVGQIRPALRARLRDPAVARRRAELLEDPARVKELDDHDLLYTDRSMLDALAFWRRSPAGELAPRPDRTASREELLGPLVAQLAAAGSAPVAVDLSAPELAALGVHAARAVIPGYQPIHFGAREARLGGLRLYHPPAAPAGHELSSDPAGLNPLPHPLS